MRNTVIAIIAIAAMPLAATAEASERSSKNENIGVGSGAIIGAVAGGPVGFFLGAAMGAKIGETMDRKNDRIAGLRDSVSRSQDQLARLERDFDALGTEIERLEGLSRPQLIDLMQAGIEMDLLFRTAEAVLADATRTRLAQLATTLADMDDIRIQLDGFADQRGAEDYNLQLSQRRVQFIRDQFVAAGVHPERINVAAHGESLAQDETADSYALERKVSVKLFLAEPPSLAAN
jgi:outer membrane protein OmpA-like peptidoglycan-associated protein